MKMLKLVSFDSFWISTKEFVYELAPKRVHGTFSLQRIVKPAADIW